MKRIKKSRRPSTGLKIYIRRQYFYRSQRIKLHVGACRYCNYGLGLYADTPCVRPDHPHATFPKQAYIGPFASIGEANAWLEGFPYAYGQVAERCQVCCGVGAYLPSNL